MEKQKLLQTLAELRAEVARADSVDPETAKALESAIRYLQDELDKRGAKPLDNIEPASSGLKDVLLGPGKLYEALREKAGEQGRDLSA